MSYGARHAALRRLRGRAHDYTCSYYGCTEQAATWAYLGNAPDEIIDPKEGKVGMAYSTLDPYYLPTCKRHNDAVDTGAGQRREERGIILDIRKRFEGMTFLQGVPMEEQIHLGIIEKN